MNELRQTIGKVTLIVSLEFSANEHRGRYSLVVWKDKQGILWYDISNGCCISHGGHSNLMVKMSWYQNTTTGTCVCIATKVSF